MQRVSSEDVVREVLETVPTPRAEDVTAAPARVTRTASPRLSVTRRSLPSGWSARSRSAGRSWRSSPRRSPCSSRSARARRASRGLSVDVELAHERALEGTEVGAVVTFETDRAIDRLELLLRLPRGVDVAEGSNAHALRLGAGESRELARSACGARAGACSTSVDVDVRARDVLRLVTWEARFEDPQRLKAYPSPLDDPAAPRAARDPGARGQRGRAREGRRRRVRRHPRLRSRRPRPLDQLARVGPPAGPRRERAPSGAQHGRRAVHRQLHGRPRRRPERARGRRPGGRVARHTLPRAARPGRARLVRRRAALAPTRNGHDAALPAHRDDARDGRRADVHVARRQSHPRPDPSAGLARARADSARGPAFHRRRSRISARAASTSRWSRSIPSRSSSPAARRRRSSPTASGCWSARCFARGSCALGIGVATWGDDELDTVLEEVRTYRRYTRLARA